MIFVAGVSPKTTVIDPTARLCPACGLARARLQRVDHYFSLFFIPVFRVKKGDVFLFCDRCNRPVNDRSGQLEAKREASPAACAVCGRELEDEHRFCPYCGQRR